MVVALKNVRMTMLLHRPRQVGAWPPVTAGMAPRHRASNRGPYPGHVKVLRIAYCVLKRSSFCWCCVGSDRAAGVGVSLGTLDQVDCQTAGPTAQIFSTGSVLHDTSGVRRRAPEFCSGARRVGVEAADQPRPG